MDNERKKIIEELGTLGLDTSFKTTGYVADFILSDRKRIVEPLINCKIRIRELLHKDDLNGGYKDLYISLLETIKLAGLHDGGKQ